MFFQKTRTRIRETTERVKDAFRLFVVTVENLTREIAANSIKVSSLSAEQTELRTKIDKLVEHSQYLATERRNELRRQGHQS